MSAPNLDVLPGLRSAVANTVAITSKLGTYEPSPGTIVPSIHTRRPVPAEAGYPMVAMGPIIAKPNADGINDFRPIVIIDINVYGEQDAQYRAVELVAETIYGLFHRQRQAITVQNYSVIDILCTGPSPAPVDDASRVGRRVTLTIRLYGK